MKNNQNIDQETEVPIKDEYRKLLPFGSLQSRNAVAIIFSLYGDSDQVLEIMRRASHRTRAYIVNAKGLKGFVVKPDLMKILNEATGMELAIATWY